MRLLKYKVNKFRSAKETEWVEMEQLTCFVGVNESGKTNLLLPLWKFNPADDTGKIDLLKDYPIDEYQDLKKDDNARKKDIFIEVIFGLSQDEINEFTKIYHECLTWFEEGKSGENSQEKEEGENEEGGQVEEEDGKGGDENGEFGQTREENRNEEEDQAEESSMVEFTNQLLVKKSYNEEFHIYILNEEGKLSDSLKEIGKELHNRICQKIPKFIYYSEYGNLETDLYLPRVIEDLGRFDSLTGKEKMKARTLRILFGHLNLNPVEIMSLGNETDSDIDGESRNKQERRVKVTAAATYLSEQFKKWWSQGSYQFKFDVDGKCFKILVSDSERPIPIELESRSGGLRWFFSFFLVFLAEGENDHRNCILLLDEPGLSLHPNAQTDLIRFFNQLSEKNQLAYTTHLPFLVDHNHLERVKAVYTEKGFTKVSNDLSKADKEKKAIQPVNAAIGITASQSLLVGCDIVIVEGVADQFYLTLIKNHLISKGKFKPKKELVFIPVGGTKGVKPVVSIIQGNTNDLPITLLDSDKEGKILQDSLKKGLYSDDENKVIETDPYADKTGSEIEDLIPVQLIVDSFDYLFRGDNRINVDDIDKSIPVVPQLEKFAEDNQIKLKPGWKVEISKQVKKKFTGNSDRVIEEKWKKLFNDLQ